MKVSLITLNGWCYERFRGNGIDCRRALRTQDVKWAQETVAQHARLFTCRSAKEMVRIRDLVIPDISLSAKSGVKLLEPSTVTRYKFALEEFVGWCALDGIEYGQMVDAEVVKRYAKFLLQQGFAGGTVKGKLMSLSAVWVANGLPTPWTAKSARVRTVEGRKSDFTDDQIRQILSLPQPENELYIVVSMMVYTGMRLSDACTLKWEEIKGIRLQKHTVKTGFFLDFDLPESVIQALNSYASERPSEGYVTPAMAALYLRSRANASTYVNRLIEKVIPCRTEKVKGRRRAVSRFSSHSFRHSFITRALKGGASLLELQKVTGTSVRLLIQRYGDHIRQEDKNKVLGMGGLKI